MSEYSDNLTDQTKAPERIWANGLGCYGDTKSAADSTEYARADLAAEQVWEAREAILIALADIPHPESTDAAEALERAYRAAEVAADMQEGSVRSIKAKANETHERLVEAARVLLGDDIALSKMAEAIHDGPLGADDHWFSAATKQGAWCLDVVRAALRALAQKGGE